MSNKYENRGVSADKNEVHAAIKNLDKGLFPNAFCKILPDFLTNDSEYCTVMHADTAGTKTSLAYMYWRETGDINIWKGIIQDALVMNIDDMACSGFTNNFVISSTIGRNKNHITGDVIAILINEATSFANKMKDFGVNIHMAGGETADVGDIVRTADVGFTAFSRMKRSDVIDIRIKEGDFVVGFASYGQASYENEYNSGIGSNGLTSARHDLFSSIYKEKYPETFDPNIPNDLVYSGTKLLTDKVSINNENINLGKLCLSPTRTFLPLLNKIIPLHRNDINGIIHNTGGGQYKVEKFLTDGLSVVKSNLLPIPPIFKIIQQESGTALSEMYKVFNMGTRLEIYTPSEEIGLNMISIAKSLNIDAQIIGKVEKGEKKVIVT